MGQNVQIIQTIKLRKMNRSLIKIWKCSLPVLLGISILVISGCSASKGTIRFDTLEYPASMSAFLFDQNQNIVMKGRDLETLSTFEFKKHYWSLIYGLVPLNKPEAEICNYLNEVIEKDLGDGIINLSITIEHGIAEKITSFVMFIPNLLPIVPSSTQITVTGEVVKLKDDSQNQYPQLDELNDNFIPKENIKTEVHETLNQDTQ